MTTDDGWWLLRCLQYGCALLVTRAEAKSEAGLAILLGELRKQLDASGIKLPNSNQYFKEKFQPGKIKE